jgi:hypothetical protein
MHATAPRHFLSASAPAAAGMPSDRAAQLAARRAFVLLKLDFVEAVSDLPGIEGVWLRREVRAAEEPATLWLLRGPVLAALAGDEPERRRRRRLLRRGLETLFPDADEPAASRFSGF